MDWKKAKTVLIIALLITNAFLLVALYVDRTSSHSLREDEERINRLLDEKNMKLDAVLPEDIITANPLIIEYRNLDIYLLNQTFFSGQGDVIYSDKEQTIIEKGNERITVNNDQALVYENDIIDTGAVELTEEDAFSKVVSFLISHSYDTQDMSLLSSQKVGRTYEFVFAKLYGDRLVLSSNTTVKTSSSGVKRMERYWPNVVEEGNAPLEISHSSKAILRLLEMSESYGKTIISVELCYYFNARDSGYVKKMTEASRGRAIPAWLVKFSDGSYTVIDNY